MGSVPSPFTLLEQGNTMEWMLWSIASEDRLQLCVCWPRCFRELVANKLRSVSPGSPEVRISRASISIMILTY